MPEFLRAENLSDTTFAAVLNRSTSNLLEDTKARVAKAFERLRPGSRSKAQDDAAKVFWTDWAKNSPPRASHDKARAARLESIACVAAGAPYVARRLLLDRRFDGLYESKETSEKERRRIIERLRKAGGGDPACLGTEGLVIDAEGQVVDADFT